MVRDKVQRYRQWMHDVPPTAQERVVWALTWTAYIAVTLALVFWLVPGDAGATPPKRNPEQRPCVSGDRTGDPPICPDWRTPDSGREVARYYRKGKYDRTGKRQVKGIVRRIKIRRPVLDLPPQLCGDEIRYPHKGEELFNARECELKRRGLIPKFYEDLKTPSASDIAVHCGSAVAVVKMSRGSIWVLGGTAAACGGVLMYEANKDADRSPRELWRDLNALGRRLSR